MSLHVNHTISEKLLQRHVWDAPSKILNSDQYRAVSKSDVIQRVNLVPLRRLDNSRTAIFETAIKPHLEENPNFYIHKNQILEFDEYEFYVKYARPLFGKIDLATTDIKIDSSTPKPVQVLRIAPIWNTDR